MSNWWKKAFGSRLSFIQARNCVAAAFVVGLLFSTVQIGFDYYRETNAVQTFASEVLEASKYAAAEASYDLDAVAAQEVVRGILEYHAVINAMVVNEEGMELAMLGEEQAIVAQKDVRYLVFGESKRFATPLFLKTGEIIGELTIVVDPVLAAKGFIDRSVLVVLAGILRNILLTFILIIVFHQTITKKLVFIGSRLAEVNIKNPLQHRIPEDRFKKGDELGDLAHTVNGMLDIITADTEELRYRANHDTLTGLVNRSGFEDRLDAALKRSQGGGAQHVLCYLDLDQFKVINDTCGHVAGDELLNQIGKVFAKGLRSKDVLARLGGDEFGILMDACGLELACQMAESICAQVEEFRFEWGGKRFALGVSIGVVAISHADTSLVELLKKADLACYAAKAAGRHRVRVYNDDEGEFSKLSDEMHWVSKINEALEDNRFKLFAQPIVAVAAPEHAGYHYEVLLRMVDPEEGLIAPGVYLSAAEEYDLISKLDRWVIENLFRYFSEHPEHFNQVWLCSVNLSGPSVANSAFQDFIVERMDYYNISPGKICFEITESAAITNLAVATKFITEMRSKGCRFALDDFGTGLCSFAYLKNLRVDYLKIDGVFVKDIVTDPLQFEMVKSIHEIGRVWGMKTIAEFVENQGILEQLTEIGIDFAQGYTLSKPRDINGIGEFYQ